MFFLFRGQSPQTFHWTLSILLPILCFSNQATFDLEKSISLGCDRHCFNGVCLNGSCLCTKGWVGHQCDHCYGRISLNENQTLLSDGPLDYSSSSKCTWIIDSELADPAPLNIKVESFTTECGWDYLYIYDGDGVYGEQLAALCGEQKSLEISAPSGKALIYFFSDLAMNLDGFNITYEFDKCPYNCSSHGICMGRNCQCDIGYTGEYCETRICATSDDNQAGPCQANGKCNNGKCECPAGRHGDLCQAPSTASVWDQIATKNQPSGRASHASVLVDDTVWTIGGEHFMGVTIDNVTVFNITSQTWTSIAVTGDLRPSPRYDHSLVRYKNKLYMFGGVINRKNITSELWSFDMQSRQWNLESAEKTNWTEEPDAPIAVAGHTAHVIGTEMYVFFGYNPNIGFVHQIQLYDLEGGNQSWALVPTTDHVYGRFRHSSVQFDSMDENNEQQSLVLVYGGTMWSNVQTHNQTDSLMQYDVKHKKWSNLLPSGVQLFLHTANMLNGLMVVVGGNGFDMGQTKRPDCFSSLVQVYDIACKQWLNATQGPSGLRRYGHTTVATKDSLYVIGGYNGRMLSDVWKFTTADCSSAARPEECRALSDSVKCVFADRECVKFDPYVSYKPTFLSFVKNDLPKGMIECTNNALRQALHVCEDQTTCVSCASQSGCGWCLSGQQCLTNGGECVDGQEMFTTWEKCPSAQGTPPPRPCTMANDCYSCKLLDHCNWFLTDGKFTCISLEEEKILIAEQHNREMDRLSSSVLPLRLPQTPPPLPHGRNLSYCPEPCAESDSCGDCIRNMKCMWCPSTNRCINMEAYTLSFAYGQCHSWVTGTSGSLGKACQLESSTCSAHKTCNECQLSPECGWLDDGSHTGLGKCIEGSRAGPREIPTDYNPVQWYFVDCPACQCNGHSMCEQTIHTLGGLQEVCGPCGNNTSGKHCEICAPGYFGDPRNGGLCSACECHGQADTCDHRTGICHCRTKGVIGEHCQKCDSKYYGTPKNGTPCYYELAVDFIFTFKLKHEDKDKYATEIYLFSIPYKRDTDVTFQISCEGSSHAQVALNITTSLDPTEQERRIRKMMYNTTCDSKGFRRVYVASDPGYTFGTDTNTTFFVQVYNFTTPITIQISFAQSPPINWVLFFVIFAACFIVLLVVAGLLWMIKLRIEVYRRNQRRIDEIEHMASRPFSSVKLELTNNFGQIPTSGPTPLSVEPCSNYKAGVFTMAIRLPTGGRAVTPNGTSGLAVASALCLLTPAQLGVLQAPDNSDNQNNRKQTLRRYIPFLRRRDTDAT